MLFSGWSSLVHVEKSGLTSISFFNTAIVWVEIRWSTKFWVNMVALHLKWLNFARGGPISFYGPIICLFSNPI